MYKIENKSIICYPISINSRKKHYLNKIINKNKLIVKKVKDNDLHFLKMDNSYNNLLLFYGKEKNTSLNKGLVFLEKLDFKIIGIYSNKGIYSYNSYKNNYTNNRFMFNSINLVFQILFFSFNYYKKKN